MAKLPIFKGSDFKWKGTTGSSNTTTLDLQEFPASGFYIKSQRSGRVQLFLPDAETMEANEFFDGEAAAYFAPGAGVTVQLWVGEET